MKKKKKKKGRPKSIGVKPNVPKMHSSWHRGKHCNFIADKRMLVEPGAIDKYIMKGWGPKKPIITKKDSIVAFGSCFARHISIFLKDRGYLIQAKSPEKQRKSYIISCGAGINNTFVLRQQLEWAFENIDIKAQTWFDENKELQTQDESVRKQTRDILDRADVFILTLGLSEIWYDKETKEVFWRAIPKDHFDPDKHGFRISTVEENTNNLERIYELIRKYRPNATIIFTLSPVPLVATFRPVSCITANSVSKSILRVAIDEVCRKHNQDKKLFYFPSYEIVKEYAKDPYKKDNRHITPGVIDLIMKTFCRYFCVEK